MATINPWEWFSAEQIASAAQVALDPVQRNFPLIAQALADRGIWTPDDVIATVGTVKIETASTFEPIHEYGTPADWANYDGGSTFAGRGFDQLTHQYNYQRCGDDLGLDLVGNPDLLLDAAHSARSFAWFYATHGVPSKDGSHYYTMQALADEPDYHWFRVGWSGGSRAADTMQVIRDRLLGSTIPSTNRLYVPDVPDSVVLQRPLDWTCSVRSTYAALWALAQQAGTAPVTWDQVYSWMVPELVSPDVGLHYADGHEIVALLNSKGYKARAYYPAQLAEAQAVAGLTPCLLGGRAWYHWVMVNGVEPDGTLLLENPAPGYKGISGQLRDSWVRLGQMTLITIEPSTAPVPVPPPAPPPEAPRTPPTYETLQTLVGVAYHPDGAVRQGLVGAMAQPALPSMRQEVENVVNFLDQNNPDR